MPRNVGQPSVPKLIGLLAFLGVVWVVSCFALWWAYDMTPQIKGGNATQSQAIHLVERMALILTVLICSVWLLDGRACRIAVGWRCIWGITWKTAVVLHSYGLLVMLRRELWRPSQGINDNAMFLPLVGTINAHFFSEFEWVIYFLELVPILAIFSGVLYWIQIRFVTTRGA